MKPVIVIPAYQPQAKLIDVVTQLCQDNEQKIIVINDGSDKACANIFVQLANMPQVVVLHHAVNLGKGQALKTGFNYFLLHYANKCAGVVTADADGQHLVEDILKVSHALMLKPNVLQLGSRKFTGVVPLRSRFGNNLTRFIFKLLVGKAITDTQTGLRGIPTELLKHLLKIKNSGYEFELDMLIDAIHQRIAIEEITIQTVYENNNASSHFNPILDSLKIYFVFLRFSALSIVTALIDYLTFAIFYTFSSSIIASFIGARIVAGSFNFTCSKALVFKSKDKLMKEAIKFAGLVFGLMLISYVLVRVMVLDFGMNVYISKIIAEGSLFLASFAIQRLFIFTHKANNT